MISSANVVFLVLIRAILINIDNISKDEGEKEKGCYVGIKMDKR
jgi:hypothetical protein